MVIPLQIPSCSRQEIGLGTTIITRRPPLMIRGKPATDPSVGSTSCTLGRWCYNKDNSEVLRERSGVNQLQTQALEAPAALQGESDK